MDPMAVFASLVAVGLILVLHVLWMTYDHWTTRIKMLEMMSK